MFYKTKIWEKDQILTQLFQYLNDFEIINKIYLILLNDEKKTNKLIQNLEGKTPSYIKTLFNNVLAQKIIKNKEYLSYEDILLEIFESKNKEYTIEDIITFLNENGVSQEKITQILNISIRQVRNNLKTK